MFKLYNNRCAGLTNTLSTIIRYFQKCWRHGHLASYKSRCKTEGENLKKPNLGLFKFRNKNFKIRPIRYNCSSTDRIETG